MTSAGKIFTGITLSGNNFLQTEKNIMLGDFESGNVQTFSLTGAKILGNNFIEINHNWYTNNSGNLVPVFDAENKNPDIILDFDEIIFTKYMDKNIFIIGIL